VNAFFGGQKRKINAWCFEHKREPLRQNSKKKNLESKTEEEVSGQQKELAAAAPRWKKLWRQTGGGGPQHDKGGVEGEKKRVLLGKGVV